jgi:hypothetical protein
MQGNLPAFRNVGDLRGRTHRLWQLRRTEQEAADPERGGENRRGENQAEKIPEKETRHHGLRLGVNERSGVKKRFRRWQRRSQSEPTN